MSQFLGYLSITVCSYQSGNNNNNNNASFIYLIFFLIHKNYGYHINRQAARLWCKVKNTQTKDKWKIKLSNLPGGEKAF